MRIVSENWMVSAISIAIVLFPPKLERLAVPEAVVGGNGSRGGVKSLPAFDGRKP